MYKHLLLFIIAFSAVSCTRKYEIKGTSSVSILDGRMLYVRVLSDSGLVNVDSAEVVHGLFHMKGHVDSTMLATLFMDDESIMPFVLEEGKITINIDRMRIGIMGTPLNDALTDFVNKKTELDDKSYEVERSESRMIMDGVDPDEIHQTISARRLRLSNEMDQLIKQFVQDNYENVLGPGIFLMVANSYPYPIITPLLQEILDKAPEQFKNHPYVRNYVVAAHENMQKMPPPMRREMASENVH